LRIKVRKEKGAGKRKTEKKHASSLNPPQRLLLPVLSSPIMQRRLNLLLVAVEKGADLLVLRVSQAETKECSRKKRQSVLRTSC
jgi:hypothetical protein